MRVDIQMTFGHSFWTKTRQNSDVIDIDIQGLLKQYWDSSERQFMVPSQSRPPTRPPIADREPTEAVLIGKYKGNVELRFLENTDVRIFVTIHPSRLITFV